MTRAEASRTVESLVRHFSAMTVQDSASQSLTSSAGEYRRAGDQETASLCMTFANAIAAVRNQGV